MNEKEIIEFIRCDTRSQAEIFESIKQRIQNRYPGHMAEEEAVAATCRLIGFFEVLVDNPLSEPPETG